MNFGFSEDQDMIRKSARDFVRGESSMERVRALQQDDTGFSRELWQKIAENGWLAALIAEEYGGVGLGYVDLVCILEEFGRGLMPEPLISTAVLGGHAIQSAGNDTQKEDLLPKIGEGAILLTLAAYEFGGVYDLAHVETGAASSNGGYVLNGTKCFVSDAATADKIFVTARTSGATRDRDGITLFIVDRSAAGIGLKAIEAMDRRPRSTLTLENVQVSPDAVIGEVGNALEVVEQTIDRATVALCAEMCGGMEELLERTVAYSQERVQFGRAIGSFQAVKHKAADMYVHLETARSSMYYAAMATDQDMPDRVEAVSVAKSMCSDAYQAVAKEAIQLHGGIGYTDECDIHLFYKRAVATSVSFGDASYHRERLLRERLANYSSIEEVTVGAKA